MTKFILLILSIIFFYFDLSYGIDKNQYFEIKNKRDLLLKNIESQPKPDLKTISDIIELDKQIKDYKNLIRMHNILINYQPELKNELSLKLAFYHRKNGDYKKSEQLLLDIFNKIKGNEKHIDFALLKLAPALLFTLKNTKKTEDSINFFKIFPSYYEKSNYYNSISHYINVMFINQFYNTNKSLKNLKFKTLNGNQFDINNLKGKYVLVDFWATWCPPCVEEIPNLASLYQKYKSSGFEIIGISLDTNQDVLKKFISKNNIKWENYFDGKAWENPIARSNMISSVPSTFLLDKNGNVLYSNLRGFLLAEILEELLF